MPGRLEKKFRWLQQYPDKEKANLLIKVFSVSFSLPVFLGKSCTLVKKKKKLKSIEKYLHICNIYDWAHFHVMSFGFWWMISIHIVYILLCLKPMKVPQPIFCHNVVVWFNFIWCIVCMRRAACNPMTETKAQFVWVSFHWLAAAVPRLNFSYSGSPSNLLISC